MSRLKEIEERCEKLEPGDWEIVTRGGIEILEHVKKGRGMRAVGDPYPTIARFMKYSCDDSNFIAHARSDIPYLLSELRAALARAERAEARMDALRGWLVDHECKNDRCPFCRTLDLIAELEKP